MKLYKAFVLFNMLLSRFLLGIFVLQNIGKSTFSISTFVIFSIGNAGLIKYKAVQQNIKILRRMTIDLQEMLPSSEKYQWKKKMQSFKRFRFICIFIKTFTFTNLVARPFFNAVITNTWNLQLLLDIWLPFELHPLVFPFVYVWELFIIFATVIMTFGYQWLLYELTTIITLLFGVLQTDITSIFRHKPPDLKKRLIGWIKLHQKLLNLARELSDFSQLPNFLDFFGCSFMMCSISYQISSTRNFTAILLFIGMLLGAFMQTFILCFFAQKLTDASKAVGDAVVQSNWQEVNNKQIKAMITIIIVRCHKPVQLRAGKFAGLSLENFAVVSLLETISF